MFEVMRATCNSRHDNLIKRWENLVADPDTSIECPV